MFLFRAISAALLPFVYFGMESALAGAEMDAGSHERGMPAIRYFPPTAYRGHSQVIQSAQDAQGVVYVTNYGALQAFDGERWKRIPVPGAGFLYGIAARADGSLAVCGVGTIGLLRPGEGGQWVYQSLLDELTEAEREGVGEVWDLYDTPEGLFFFTRRMMLRWHDDRMTVWHFETEKMIYGFWSGSAVYIQNLDHGLFRLAGDDVVPVSEARLFQLPGPRLILDDDDGLLVVTMREGLWHWRGHEPTPFPTEADDLLAEERFNRGLRLADGRLALGTYRGSVVFLTPDGRFDYLLGEASGLPSNGILHLSEDREGGLWCSVNNGIARVDSSGLHSFFDRRTGLPAAAITHIQRVGETLFLASGTGLFRLGKSPPPDVPQWEEIPEGRGEIFDFAERDGDLFVASGGRVLHFDGEDWHILWDQSHLVRSLFLSRLYPDVLIIGGRFGAALIRREAGVWKAGPPVPGLSEDYVQSIAQTPDGTVWLGTVFSGLIRMEDPGEANAWTTEAAIRRIGPEDGYPVRNQIMVQSREDTLHITSPEGVFIRESASGTFVPLDEAPPSAPLTGWAWDASIRDVNGHEWGSVYPLEGAEDDFNTYFGRRTPGSLRPDGEPLWEWIPPGLFESIGGVLHMHYEPGDPAVIWLGGWTGLLRWEVDRAPLGAPVHVPTVSIREVTHETQGTVFAGAGEIAEWEQAHSRRALRFAFAAPVHTSGVDVRYRSRLEGYEAEWTEWSSTASREFTNLPGGRYRFLVEAKTDLATSAEPAVAAFLIHPPWYLAKPALAAYLAGLGLVLWGGVRWRLGAARRENRRLESIVAERTTALSANEARLREARDAAEQANRAKSRFLANMSHELRTPLNAIMGYAQILGRDPAIGEENLRRIGVLRSSGALLLHLINEVLDLSKVEAGKIEIRPGPTNLRALVGALVETFRPKAAHKGLRLGCTFSTGFPDRVLLDGHRVEQILFNLLGNAFKFTDSGEIRVETAVTGNGRFCIVVSDTGEGIPAEQLAAIFEPFHQGGHTPAAEPGTGLGLAISRSLATALGGSLSCKSTPGSGSRFRLELPLETVADLPETARPDRAIIGYEGDRRRLLVVDDLPVNRDIVAEMLEPLGFIVEGANDGTSALAQADAHRPDLILLDMRMAPMDGSEVMRRLRSAPWGRDLPVISYSASLLDFSREDALALGCNDSITKPFLIEDLLSKIGDLLQLAWIYAEDEAAASTDSPTTEFAFSPEDFATLRALAHRREPAGLKRELIRIHSEDTNARPAVDRLLSLLAAFRLAELSGELENHAPRADTHP
ncbi:MAG: response regulator [Opitutales bacterium]|nr:response regulator [Opitutales bacterium]